MDRQPYKLGTIVTNLLLVAATGVSVMTTGLTVTAQPASARAARSPKFRSANGKFAIAFPQQPQLKQEKDSNGHTIYNFVTNEGSRSYLVSYFDQPELKHASRSTVQSLLLRIVTGFTAGAEMKLVRAQGVNLGRHPGREFDFTGAGVVGKGRAYVVGTRVYLLVGVDNERSVNSFLNSFRLL
jgi:hypothetical protein